jgi:hypothetical protein
MIENKDLGCFNGFKILSRKVQQTALLLSLKKPSKLDNIVEPTARKAVNRIIFTLVITTAGNAYDSNHFSKLLGGKKSAVYDDNTYKSQQTR